VIAVVRVHLALFVPLVGFATFGAFVAVLTGLDMWREKKQKRADRLRRAERSR
jgi:hypothetical protein